MTVGDLLDKVDVGAMTRTMIRTALRSLAPGVLDKRIGVRIDRAAGRVVVTLDGVPYLDTTFAEIEGYVESAGK